MSPWIQPLILLVMVGCFTAAFLIKYRGIPLIDWIEAFGFKFVARVWEWKLRRQKFIWKCYRDGGGGGLRTPYAMREEQAVSWLQSTARAEIFYIDREYHFLFYRSKSP